MTPTQRDRHLRSTGNGPGLGCDILRLVGVFAVFMAALFFLAWLVS